MSAKPKFKICVREIEEDVSQHSTGDLSPLQNVPALCWGDPQKPPVIETNTGRKRLNILGVYNPDTHSFAHLTGEEDCNLERVIEYFSVITAAYPTAPRIVLILDNAKYFKAKIVSQWLEDRPKFKIEFSPPYAPNLNLRNVKKNFSK